jgi:hypothetical protein
MVRTKNGKFSRLSNSMQNGRIRVVNDFKKAFFNGDSKKNCHFRAWVRRLKEVKKSNCNHFSLFFAYGDDRQTN